MTSLLAGPFDLYPQLLLLWSHHTAANLWIGSCCSLSNSLATAHRTKERTDSHSAKKRKVGCLKLKALHKFNGPTLGSPRTQLTREKLWKAKIIPVCPSQLGKIHKWLQQRLHIRGVPSTEKKYEAIDIKKNTRITWRADYSTVEDLGLASSWRSLVFRNWGKRRAKSCQNGQYKLKHCKDI